jgi:lambda repressor-like predicted transcriptional regulator
MARKQCTICNSAERARAELLLATGESFAAVSRRTGLSQDALSRHWNRHCSEELRESLKPSARAIAARLELGAQIAEEGTSTLEHLRGARALLWQLLIEEREAGHTSLAVMAATQYTKICSLIAKITGEWADSPLISQTTINLHFTESPEFQQLMADIAEALAPYPEARRAVFATFAALDQDSQSLPALEHMPSDPVVHDPVVHEISASETATT